MISRSCLLAAALFSGLISVPAGADDASEASVSEGEARVGRITSGFGQRRDPFHGSRRGHAGLDIAAPHGTPVFATADGVVTRANRWGSYGLIVVIDHPSGHETRFAHLSAIKVREGSHVRRGQLIGNIGSTGRSTGPHLHYEVRLNGVPLDPRKFM
jgi:murein DD-endopeptidase MepM/ murein hydrolase activator NlpD